MIPLEHAIVVTIRVEWSESDFVTYDCDGYPAGHQENDSDTCIGQIFRCRSQRLCSEFCTPRSFFFFTNAHGRIIFHGPVASIRKFTAARAKKETGLALRWANETGMSSELKLLLQPNQFSLNDVHSRDAKKGDTCVIVVSSQKVDPGPGCTRAGVRCHYTPCVALLNDDKIVSADVQNRFLHMALKSLRIVLSLVQQ